MSSLVEQAWCFKSELFKEETKLLGKQSELADRSFEELAIRASYAITTDSPVRQTAELSHFLFHSEGFRFSPHKSHSSFQITSLINTKCGNCLGLTTLYVLLAQRLCLAISPLLFEGHITAYTEDGSTTRVVELSRGGLLLSERLVKLLFGDSIGRQLSFRELFAVHLSNSAALVVAPTGNNHAALEKLNLAIDLFPEYLSARINRTALLMRMGDREEAASELQQVLRLPSGTRYHTIINYLCDELGKNIDLTSAGTSDATNAE